MFVYFRRYLAVLLFSIFAFSLSSQATDSSVEDFGEDEIIIEADRQTIPGQGEPGQTTVVTRDELEVSGARSLADFLQRVPGVNVSRQGGILETATISIRGSSAEQVLILVDGEAQNTIWGGAVNINTIPLDRIESIEIIRGGGSALYGEGALGGVISITTRKGDAWEPELSVTGGFGSFNTIIGGFNLSGGLDKPGNFTGRLSGEVLKTEGTYSYESDFGGAIRLNNKGTSESLSGGLTWDPKGSGIFYMDLSGEGQMTERGIPGLMEFLTPEAEKSEHKWGLGLTMTLQEKISGKWKLFLGGNRSIDEYTNPEENLDETHDNLGGTARLDWESPEVEAIVSFRGALGVQGGVDSLDSTGLTDSTGTALNGEAQQLSGSAWGSLNMAYKWTSLVPALRIDYFSQEYIGRELINRSALSWSLTTEVLLSSLVFELSGQSSYHNPSFQDLFWPSGAFASGNPDLLPEKGLGGDLGIIWNAPAGTTVSAAGYFQQVSDLIQWLPAAGGIWRPRNIGKVEIYGAEFYLKGIIPIEKITNFVIPWFLEYQAGYDWLRCINITPDSVNFGNQLAYHPEHSGSLAILLTAPGGSSLEIAGTFQGEQFSNNANTKFFDILSLFDASWRFFITPSWEISVTGRNLTNKLYIDNFGYPVPGIEWIIQGGFHY